MNFEKNIIQVFLTHIIIINNLIPVIHTVCHRSLFNKNNDHRNHQTPPTIHFFITVNNKLNQTYFLIENKTKQNRTIKKISDRSLQFLFFTKWKKNKKNLCC